MEQVDENIYDGPERGVWKNKFGIEKWYLDDVYLHRDYGPARKDPDGSEYWFQKGKPHRIGGPAVKKSNNSVSQYVNGKFYMTGSEYWYENGELHRIDGPARIDSDGSEYWYQHGEPHRIGGPAIIDPVDGTEEWYENGEPHRIGGPARIYADGTEYWYENGKYNRIGGPAVIDSDGTEEWYKDGELHNDVGPAFISSTGKKQYWIEGKQLTEDQFLRYKKMYEKSERRKISPEWHGLKEWGLRPLATGELKRHFDEMQEYGIIDPDEEFDEESMRELTKRYLRKEEIEREIFEDIEEDDAGVYDGPERGVSEEVYDGPEVWKYQNKLHRDYGPAFTKPDGSEYWYQNDKLHRVGGPAITEPDGTKMWYENDKSHRVGGPATIKPDGSEEWYENGKLHRIGGPAITELDGSEYWYQNYKLHRVGGPAITESNGTKMWYENDKLHRDDGPAKIDNMGIEYWVEGVKLTKNQFLRYKKMKEKSDRQKKFPAWHGLKEWGLRPLATGQLKQRFDEMQEYGIIDPDEEFDEESMRTLTTRSLRQEEVDREIFEDAGVYDDETVMVIDKKSGKVTYEKVSSLIQ